MRVSSCTERSRSRYQAGLVLHRGNDDATAAALLDDEAAVRKLAECLAYDASRDPEQLLQLLLGRQRGTRRELARADLPQQVVADLGVQRTCVSIEHSAPAPAADANHTHPSHINPSHRSSVQRATGARYVRRKLFCDASDSRDAPHNYPLTCDARHVLLYVPNIRTTGPVLQGRTR